MDAVVITLWMVSYWITFTLYISICFLGRELHGELNSAVTFVFSWSKIWKISFENESVIIELLTGVTYHVRFLPILNYQIHFRKFHLEAKIIIKRCHDIINLPNTDYAYLNIIRIY